MPFAFAVRINAFVASLTCGTLPAAEEIASCVIVWIESIITISGFNSFMLSKISSTSVSVTRYRFSVVTPKRSARILICPSLSSPETYSIFLSSPTFSQICKSSVDLPIPGSPPTRISEPLTIPPPSTRSSSFKPVLYLVSNPALTSPIFFGIRAGAVFSRTSALVADVFFSGVTSVSSIVFQLPQDGHFPSHFGDL